MTSENSFQFSFHVEDDTKTVVINDEGDELLVTVADRAYRVSLPITKQGVLYFAVDGQQMRATVAKTKGKWYVHVGGRPWTFSRPSPSRSRRGGTDSSDGPDSGLLRASMPGQVIEVWVEVGETVKQGQALLLLEAMKMELRITAPFDGVIQTVYCNAGDTVDRNEPLVELNPPQE